MALFGLIFFPNVYPNVSKVASQKNFSYISVLMGGSQHNSPQYVQELIDKSLFLDNWPLRFVGLPSDQFSLVTGQLSLVYYVVSAFDYKTVRSHYQPMTSQLLWKSINPSPKLNQSSCIFPIKLQPRKDKYRCQAAATTSLQSQPKKDGVQLSGNYYNQPSTNVYWMHILT